MGSQAKRTSSSRTKRAPAGETELTREQIIAAVTDLIKEVGPAGFSMRTLAARLNCSAMSPYRHVANKDELLALAADSILNRIVLPSPDLPWEERFERFTQAVWEQVMEHRWLPNFYLHRNRSTPGLERLLGELELIFIASGLDPEDAREGVLTAWLFVAGLLSWAADPAPHMEFGLGVILEGLQQRRKSQHRTIKRAAGA